MRLWSLHPKYLDTKGLVALWREGLLAQAVLQGRTRGYRNHPQIERFRAHPAPVSAINNYLKAVADEADRRGYDFDRSKIGPVRDPSQLPLTEDQLAFEVEHLRRKLDQRAPDEVARLGTTIEPHPLFEVWPGPVEAWERSATITAAD